MGMADVTEQSFSGWATAGFMGALNLIEGLQQKGLRFSQADVVQLQEFHERLGKAIDRELDERFKE